MRSKRVFPPLRDIGRRYCEPRWCRRSPLKARWGLIIFPGSESVLVSLRTAFSPNPFQIRENTVLEKLDSTVYTNDTILLPMTNNKYKFFVYNRL
jgi:hypothetical protein